MEPFAINVDVSDLMKGLELLGKEATKALQRGLLEAGESLRYDSTNIVPFDRGFDGGLAGSASTQLDDELGVIVGYNMSYAAELHEDMTLKIKQKNTVAGQVRQQKYLEKPAQENAEKYGKIVSDSLSELLK
jgi:hypothetical protein